MPLLERYILRSTLLAFLAVLTALTGTVWVTQALRQVDLVTAKGQTLWLFLFIAGLGLPSLVAILGPVALFIAVIATLNRLNADSELVVMSSAGVSPARLLRPFLLLAVAVAALTAALTLYSVPSTLRILREEITRVRADLVTNILNEGAFTTVEKGLTIHVRERGAGAALLGIFVQDERDPAHVLTYIAENGRLVTEQGRTLLVLDQGSVQRRDVGQGDVAIVVFERYALDLSELANAAAVTSYKPRERYTSELLWPNRSDPDFAGAEGRFRSELHDRLVNPLYPVAFVVMAYAAVGRARTTRQGRSGAIAIAVALVLAVRLGGLGAANLAALVPAAVVLVYALPLAAIIGGLAFIYGIRPSWPWRRRPALAPAPA